MTKQEEVREEAISLMTDRIEQDGEHTGRGAWLLAQSLYDNYLLPYLDSQDVVVKVERELPENPYPESVFPMSIDEGGKIQRERLGDKLTTSVNGGFGRHVYSFCQQDMKDAGYVAVERLILV